MRWFHPLLPSAVVDDNDGGRAGSASTAAINAANAMASRMAVFMEVATSWRQIMLVDLVDFIVMGGTRSFVRQSIDDCMLY